MIVGETNSKVVILKAKMERLEAFEGQVLDL